MAKAKKKIKQLENTNESLEDWGNATDCGVEMISEELKDTKLMLKLAMDFIMKYTQDCPSSQEHDKDCPFTQEQKERGDTHVY